MNLLVFMQQEKSALILTDTIATTPDGEPFMFTQAHTRSSTQQFGRAG